jgi:hypothetical protein
MKPPTESKIYRNSTESPMSAVPEFASMGGVLISYPGTVTVPLPPLSNKEQLPPTGPRAFGIPNELVVRMQQNDTDHPVHTFVMCDDLDQFGVIARDMNETAGKLGLSFNPDHLHLIPWDTDTFWTRDYGPWWAHNRVTGRYGIAKHSYTTLGGGSVGLVEGAEKVPPTEGLGIFRPNDDYGAVKLSDFLDAPVRAWNSAQWPGRKKNKPIDVHDWFFLGLLDVGGNYMVTGKGVLASSYLVATQNEIPATDEKELTNPDQRMLDRRMTYILEQMNRFLGVHTYHVLADPTGTYIGHIDCWGKFLADDKVLIARSEDKKIDTHFDSISESFAKEGFGVYRVLCQNVYVPSAVPPATTAAYTNSLILNDHVYVPLAGKGYERYDSDALAVYSDAMPDHTVVGILGKPEFPWLGTDAMHCRTRGIPRAVVDNWLKSLLAD